jgi:hypothetical protein
MASAVFPDIGFQGYDSDYQILHRKLHNPISCFSSIRSISILCHGAVIFRNRQVPYYQGNKQHFQIVKDSFFASCTVSFPNAQR